METSGAAEQPFLVLSGTGDAVCQQVCSRAGISSHRVKWCIKKFGTGLSQQRADVSLEEEVVIHQLINACAIKAERGGEGESFCKYQPLERKGYLTGEQCERNKKKKEKKKGILDLLLQHRS